MHERRTCELSGSVCFQIERPAIDVWYLQENMSHFNWDNHLTNRIYTFLTHSLRKHTCSKSELSCFVQQGRSVKSPPIFHSLPVCSRSETTKRKGKMDWEGSGNRRMSGKRVESGRTGGRIQGGRRGKAWEEVNAKAGGRNLRWVIKRGSTGSEEEEEQEVDLPKSMRKETPVAFNGRMRSRE